MKTIVSDAAHFKGFPGGSDSKQQQQKKQTATWETGIESLGWEDPLEAGMAACSSMFAWRIPMDGADWRTAVHGVAKSRTEAMERCFIDM